MTGDFENWKLSRSPGSMSTFLLILYVWDTGWCPRCGDEATIESDSWHTHHIHCGWCMERESPYERLVHGGNS